VIFSIGKYTRRGRSLFFDVSLHGSSSSLDLLFIVLFDFFFSVASVLML
jgi:hypothetical protein